MKFIILCLMATAAFAKPSGYGGQQMSYGGGSSSYGSNVVGQMQPAQNPQLRQTSNTASYGSVTYTAPGQVYTAQPVTYVAPQLTFSPPQVQYTGQTVVYSQPAADASGPQVLNMASSGSSYSGGSSSSGYSQQSSSY